MLPLFRRSLLLACLALALASPGCGDRGGHVKAISAQEAETGIADIFKAASPETRQTALDIGEALKKHEYPAAWEKLQALGQTPGLTPQQQEFVASCTAAIGAEVEKASAAGDEASKQALEFHRANK